MSISFEAPDWYVIEISDSGRECGGKEVCFHVKSLRSEGRSGVVLLIGARRPGREAKARFEKKIDKAIFLVLLAAF